MNNQIGRSILKNELKWLESINCQVKYMNTGILISNQDNKTDDFNFYIPQQSIDESQCNRLSDMNDNYEFFSELLLEKGKKCQSVYDINYVRNAKYVDNGKPKFDLLKSDIDIWEPNSKRRFNEYSKYYYIALNGEIIGKINIVTTQGVYGIYDYEIFPKYQNIGFGTEFLYDYCSHINGTVFIQTWSENLAAVNCYTNSGFEIYEKLYRYA